VPIRPYLEGEFFDPELIEAMSRALADACRELELKDMQNVAVRLLAGLIIDEAKQGTRDPALLKTAATKVFRPARRR
jgi:hypothetical protein